MRTRVVGQDGMTALTPLRLVKYREPGQPRPHGGMRYAFSPYTPRWRCSSSGRARAVCAGNSSTMWPLLRI